MKPKLLLVFVPVCLLGACALEPKRVEPPATRVIVQPAPASESDQLLVYLAQAKKLDARGLASEREQTRSALQAEKSEFNRVRLAMLLVSAMPSAAASTASANDDTELISLLEPLVSAAAASATEPVVAAQKADVRALAALIYAMAQDRRKLRELARDAQARVNALRRDDTKEVEARALRARVDELERKLAALKSIDRSVNRRAEAQRPEAPRVEPPK